MHIMGHFCILIHSGMDPTWSSLGAVLQCGRPSRPDHLIEGKWGCLWCVRIPNFWRSAQIPERKIEGRCRTPLLTGAVSCQDDNKKRCYYVSVLFRWAPLFCFNESVSRVHWDHPWFLIFWCCLWTAHIISDKSLDCPRNQIYEPQGWIW